MMHIDEMNIRTQTSSLIFISTDNIVFRITYQGTVVDYELLAIESVVLGALYSLFQLDLNHTPTDVDGDLGFMEQEPKWQHSNTPLEDLVLLTETAHVR